MGLAIKWTIQLKETNNTSFNHLQLLHKTSQRLNYRLNKQVGICPRISKKVFLSCSVDQQTATNVYSAFFRFLKSR